MLWFWFCFVLKNLVQCIAIFHFGLKMYFVIELEKCITTLERFVFHKEKLSDAWVRVWCGCAHGNLKGADVNDGEIGIVEDNSSLSEIYKETSFVVEFSTLMSWITQVCLIWDLLCWTRLHVCFGTIVEIKSRRLLRICSLPTYGFCWVLIAVADY